MAQAAPCAVREPLRCQMKMAPDEKEALTAAAAAAVAAALAQARCSATWRAHSDSWRHEGQAKLGEWVVVGVVGVG